MLVLIVLRGTWRFFIEDKEQTPLARWMHPMEMQIAGTALPAGILLWKPCGKNQPVLFFTNNCFRRNSWPRTTFLQLWGWWTEESLGLISLSEPHWVSERTYRDSWLGAAFLPKNSSLLPSFKKKILWVLQSFQLPVHVTDNTARLLLYKQDTSANRLGLKRRHLLNPERSPRASTALNTQKLRCWSD